MTQDYFETDYKDNLKGLKSFINLTAFNDIYSAQKAILDQCDLSNAYYYLLELYGLKFARKEDFLKIVKCFLANYDTEISNIILRNDKLKLIYDNSQIKPKLEYMQNKLLTFNLKFLTLPYQVQS